MIKLLLQWFGIGLLYLTVTSSAIAQTTDEIYNDDKFHSEFGLNITGMVAQFIPLNNSTLKDFSLFDYQYKLLRNGKGARFGLAVEIREFGFGSNRFNFRMGYEHRNVIKSSRFMISGGIDLVLLLDKRFEITFTPEDVPRFLGIGGDLTLGFEYMVFPNVSLGIESLLIVTTSFEELAVRIVPPLSLNVYFRI